MYPLQHPGYYRLTLTCRKEGDQGGRGGGGGGGGAFMYTYRGVWLQIALTVSLDFS